MSTKDKTIEPLHARDIRLAMTIEERTLRNAIEFINARLDISWSHEEIYLSGRNVNVFKIDTAVRPALIAKYEGSGWKIEAIDHRVVVTGVYEWNFKPVAPARE